MDFLDDRLTIEIFQLDAQLGHTFAQFLTGETTDISLAAQGLENTGAQLGSRRHAGSMPCTLRVADPGEQITQRIRK
ncbi:hypothetical protein SXCC_03758 [Gluconacetobacter sp. SXCC-1]|nr:hypothetical protein SXCC_03758 [Gluconacetobacter sp. SXCC-1]